MKKQSEIKQTRMIGLRVADDLFHLIEDGAKSELMSPTSFARITLARSLGYVNAVPETRSRKRLRPKPISKEIRAAIEVLGLLIDIRTALSALSNRNENAQLAKQRADTELIRQGEIIEHISKQIDAIRAYLIGLDK